MAINVTDFNAALEQIEIAKGISREVILNALKEAMIKGFKKDIGQDDALVEVNIDPNKGVIDMFQIKKVVEEVEDDLLEISVEDANEKEEKYKVGDDDKIPASVENLRKAIALSIKSVLKQKLAEAEKEVLLDQFKDKIGTMITGKVESVDEKGAYVNIGRTSIYLPRKEMIKDEKFIVGENIKLFVNDVDSNNKGAHIVVSRASEGFLKALMTEEIHDIYDGTIEIKAVAREAGERSKVAVISRDINVDPAGTCIGPNGSRIQKVVSQLGNVSSKEKIDIIAYSDNKALYIMEALKPAKIAGIKLDEETKNALVVVRDDSLSAAIGKKGVNTRLASRLTGFKIDIKTETEANETGIEYVTFEELSALELANKAERIAQAQREALVYPSDISLPGVPEGYVAPQERKYEDETNDFDSALEAVADKEEETVVVKPVKEEPKVEAPVVEEEKVEEVAPAKEEKKAEVKTTTTLEDLEKSLEASAKKETKSKDNRRKKKAAEEEKEEVALHTEGPRMSIYTEEELAEMEEEEKEIDEVEEDDIDYDDYDQYYDED